MTAIRSSKLIGPVSITVTVMMVTLLLPVGLVTGASAEEQSQLLVVFPVLDTSDGDFANAARRMTDSLQIAIDEIPGLRATEFSRTSPVVRRAVNEGQVRSIDVEAEVADAVTALKIGYALGADEVCLATITSITVNDEPRQISVLLAGQCYRVQENIDVESGQVVEELVMSNSFGVSGQSMERVNYRGADSVLLNQAIRSAASKAAQVLAGAPAVATDGLTGKKKPSKAWKWFIAGLLIAGLAMAANSSTSHTPAGPAANALPPSPPLRVTLEPSTIRLEWQAPQGTSLTVLRYRIQRSSDGGATWSFIDNGLVGADKTSFGDFHVTNGVTYRYRIQTLYTGTDPSRWISFDEIQFTN